MSPRAFGSYELVEILGRGGMGEVWRAKHHALQRDVALKLIRPRETEIDPEHFQTLVRRFEREARATSALMRALSIT